MDDCLKSFVCLASAMPSESREGLEAAVTSAFDGQIAVDPTDDAAEFSLASAVGRRAGASQCGRLYARCPATYWQVREKILEAAQQAEEGVIDGNQLI